MSAKTKLSKGAFYSPGKTKASQGGVDCTFPVNSMTTPVGGDLYRTPSKQVLVTRDPVYKHPTIFEGHYIGPQPHSYMPLAIVVTILNPLIGFMAVIFAYMSIRSYRRGDVTYAYKWSNHAFLVGIITIVVSAVLYTAIGFALSPIGVRGGHSY